MTMKGAKGKHYYKKFIDEPVMSDKTLLVSVEDLIAAAFGPLEKNTVNFKLVQTILHILARQLRLLEQDVEIKFDELGIDVDTGTFRAGHDTYDRSDEEYSDEYDEDEYSTSEEEEEGRDAGSVGGGVGSPARKERGGIGERGEKGRGERGERGGKGEKRRGKRGSKDMGTTTGLGGEDDGDEGEGGGGRARRGKRGRKGEDDGEEGEGGGGRARRGKRGRKGEDDGEEGEGAGGRRRGGRGRRGEDEGDEVEGGSGRRRGGRGRRGEDEGDEVEGGSGRRRGGRGRRGEDEDEAEGGGGRRHGGKSRDREDRGADRHGERRGESRGERGGGRRGERDGEYDESEDRGGRRRVGREESGTSITVSEATRKGDGKGGAAGKVLVAERGPATHGRVARVGSIEVVTASQFALLDNAVRRLEKFSGPLPTPALPDNAKLRKDLAKGRASLSDTMEAVQLNARVQAAEEGLSRMAGLLTQLATAGVLPPDFASRIGELKAAMRKPTMAGGQVAGLPFDPKAMFGAGAGAGAGAGGGGGTGAGQFGADDEAGADQAGGRGMKSVEPSTGRSDEPGGGGAPGDAVPAAYETMHVTHTELHDILEQMKELLNKEIQNMTARANHSVDIASNTSRTVSDKLAIALAIDDRVSNLYQQTADYAVQLNGFDTGLTTQMASFQEQMTMMRNDLRGGLDMLETANNNAETAAILDLTERYENLVIELDNTAHLHSNLNIVQQHIGDELKSLVECVEMLREQKADRDEVLDCLRDKADISRLAGLLYEKDFAKARFEIEKRIEKSYEKFYKQDEIWQNAMRDLTRICEHKAELISLMGLKDKTTQDLNAIQNKLYQLETMLGEPQAALLTRRLAAGAACGACLARAVMPMEDATHGKPMALPALRPPPVGADDVCLGSMVLRPPETRDHICHRWVGGSHTLVSGNIKREKAGPAQLQTVPTKKFEGYGIDGKLYMMEEDLQPCAECNKFSTDEEGKVPPHSPTPTGGGDQN